MTNGIPSPGNMQKWRTLYTAALFETDRNRVRERIAEAEQAIVARARELFSAGNDTIEEDQALDDALYALRALQSCLEVQTATAA
jgi:2-keto-3-deoxy-galactonokinase